MRDPLAILAEPRRREILRLVWGQERSAGEIAARFDVTFGAVSQHLAVLRGAGLVTRRREGKRQIYAADRAAIGPLAPVLEAMWADRLSALKDLAEADQSAIEARRGRDWTGIHAPDPMSSGRCATQHERTRRRDGNAPTDAANGRPARTDKGKGRNKPGA